MQQTPEPQERLAGESGYSVVVHDRNAPQAQREDDTTEGVAFPTAADHYRIVIEDARALRNGRDTINSMFVSIVSLIAGGAGYVFITYSGNTVGLVVVLAAAIFGFRLCHVWEHALGNYGYLLNFRYATLKFWETQYNFPSERTYYASEDILYSQLPTPTELSEQMPKKWVGKAGAFVNLYTELPKAARLLFIALAILEVVAFAVRLLAPFAAHLPITLPPLPF